MEDRKLDPALIYLFKSPPKITVIEGADGAGKTTIIKQLQKEYGKEYRVRVLRFPDNRGDVGIRRAILDSDMAEFNLGHVFLFLADFVHAWEEYVKPHLNDDKTIFIFDRFIPSVCVYQKVTIEWINYVFNRPQLKGFVDTMRDIQYVYLIPNDLEKHKARLASKKGEELNCLDPVGDEAIVKQLVEYNVFMFSHENECALLGSNKVLAVNVF